MQHPINYVKPFGLGSRSRGNTDNGIALIAKLEQFDAHTLEYRVDWPLHSWWKRLFLTRRTYQDAIHWHVDVKRFDIPAVRRNRDNRCLTMLVNHRIRIQSGSAGSDTKNNSNNEGLQQNDPAWQRYASQIRWMRRV